MRASNDQVLNESSVHSSQELHVYGRPLTFPPVTVFDRVFAHAVRVEAFLVEAKVQLHAVQSQRCRGRE